MTVEFPALVQLFQAFRKELDQLPTNTKGSQAANRATQKTTDAIIEMLKAKRIDCSNLDHNLFRSFVGELELAVKKFECIQSEGGFKRLFGKSETEKKVQLAIDECTSKVLPNGKLMDAIEKIKGSSATKALYDETMGEQPWMIAYSVDKKALTFGAFSSIGSRSIFLSATQSVATLTTLLIFELINAGNRMRFKAIDEKALKGQMECEDFVRQKATIEFEGSIRHHEIILAAHKEQPSALWKNLDCFSGHSTFEKFWFDYAATAHADQYRAIWYQHYRK